MSTATLSPATGLSAIERLISIAEERYFLRAWVWHPHHVFRLGRGPSDELAFFVLGQNLQPREDFV